MNFFKELRHIIPLTLVLLLLCGLAYPLALTGLGQWLAPEKAEGSLLSMDGTLVGSALVGQHFTAPHFLKGRPSAVTYNTYTAEQKASGAYTGVASGSTNLAPSNPKLAERVAQDMQALLEAHPGVRAQDVPTDALTASGSGLDPHISPAAAHLQIPALARHSGLSKESLRAILDRHTAKPVAGIFGTEHVHVLKVNMDIARALHKQSREKE